MNRLAPKNPPASERAPEDFSIEGPIAEDKDFTPIEEPYDPRPKEDEARRKIAYILLGILAFIIGWATLTISVQSFSPETMVAAEKSVSNILTLILSPIIALVSAATGFYYGSKNNHSGQNR